MKISFEKFEKELLSVQFKGTKIFLVIPSSGIYGKRK
jgi:hypothetical protein